MALLFDREDFAVGEFQFQFQGDQNYWLQKLEETERLILIQIFGVTLYNKLKADPNDADFAPIKEPFVYRSKSCKGLKYVVMALVYSELILNGGVYTANTSGNIKSETTEKVSIQRDYTRAYNQGVLNVEVLRGFLSGGVPGLEDYDFSYKYDLSYKIW